MLHFFFFFWLKISEDRAIVGFVSNNMGTSTQVAEKSTLWVG